MMPFFFTMPISRMMPMMATMSRSRWNSISASSAPTPAEGSVERIVIGMDEALVQHAEHDVDGHQRRQNQQALVRQRAFEGRGRALIIGDHAGRQIRPSRWPCRSRPAPGRASIPGPD